MQNLDKDRKLEIIKTLSDNKRYLDFYILSRYMYKIKEDLIDDKFYEKLHAIMVKYELTPLVNQTYDDDETPVELIEEFGLGFLEFADGGSSQHYDSLNGDKSMSIRALEDYLSAWNYFNSNRGLRKIVSGKRNGLNIKSLFEKNDDSSEYNDFKLGLTRGRSGDSIDISKVLSKNIPLKVKGSSETVTVYGECIVNESGVKEIPRNDGSRFTSARMAANSMLRVEVSSQYYKYFHYQVFNADGVSDTISGTLDILKECGFETVPYYLIEADEVPETFDEFKPWLKNIMKRVYDESRDLDFDYDGVVVDIDEKNYESKMSNQYLSRNCALKFEYFSYKYYLGKVKSIITEQQRVQASVVVEIEPLKGEDGATNRRVTSYNPSYVIDNNYLPGNPIYFERNSGAITVPITGYKLKKILNGENDSYKLESFSKGE